MTGPASAAAPRRDAWAALGLFCFALAFHAPIVGFDFVNFDDPQILLAHPERYDAHSLAASLRAIFVEDFPREEPLPIRDLSWAIEARLFGFGNAAAHHAGNLLLSAGVVALLFAFLRRTGLGLRAAAVVGIAFVVAPIHVEPIAWVMGRKDLLVAFFSLLALLAQHAALAAPASRTRRLAYAATLVFTALALGSKISAIALVLVLALHRAFWPWLAPRMDVEPSADPLSRSPRALLARSIVPLLPHAALTLAIFLAYRRMLASFRVLDAGNPGALDPEHLANVVSFAPLIAAHSIARLIWPHALSAYYRFPRVDVPLAPMEWAASALIALAGAGLLLLALRRRPIVAFHALFAATLMLPYSGVFYVGFWQADRYLYLASAGLLACAGLLTAELWQRFTFARRPLALALAALLASHAALAHQQRGVWSDNESLWTHEIGLPEPPLLAFEALGREFVRRAEGSREPGERAEFAVRADRIVAQGLARDAEIAVRPSRYRLPEIRQRAGLHVLQGRLARLRGESPEAQAVHFRTAFAIAPEASAALYAFESLVLAAERAPASERDRLAAEAFDYYLQWVAYSAHDPKARATSAAVLESRFAGRYPALAPRIDDARRTWFQ
ncbi:MAG: hypothetical protein R3F21_09820 [Myxococcota bacterium]